MRIVPFYPSQDASQGQTAPGDSLYSQWGQDVPVQQPTGLERAMLAEDKLFVVLVVVLLIWSGILFFLFRTDRKLHALEQSVAAGIPPVQDDL